MREKCIESVCNDGLRTLIRRDMITAVQERPDYTAIYFGGDFIKVRNSYDDLLTLLDVKRPQEPELRHN